MGETFLDRLAVLVASFAFGCCKFMVLSFSVWNMLTAITPQLPQEEMTCITDTRCVSTA
jgi:hypothetical protein